MKTNNQWRILAVLPTVRPFINPGQLCVMADAVRGEESDWFAEKFETLAELIEKMPKTYGQDGKGDEAVVHLHYFKGGMDWFITEKDADTDGEGQCQAYGLADLYRDGGELGYVSISELIGNGVELDLHFTPRPLGQVKAERVVTPAPRKDTRQTAFDLALRKLITNIEQKAKTQFTYNENVNMPEGRMEADETLPHALSHGVAAAWNTCQEWDCNEAKALAYAVLEDANCHREAARIYMKPEAIAA